MATQKRLAPAVHASVVWLGAPAGFATRRDGKRALSLPVDASRARGAKGTNQRGTAVVDRRGVSAFSGKIKEEKPMAFEQAKQDLEAKGLGERILVLDQSSATVQEAADALGCEPRQIAKTMSFLVQDEPILVVMAGDARVDNKKYKNTFQQKAKMIPGELVESLVGHEPGVCPFGAKEGVPVYFDVSLRRFERVYPAAGNDHSAVDLSLEEFLDCVPSAGWVDIGKGWCE